MAEVKHRYKQADYLEVDGKYEFLGLGFKEANEEPNAQTKSVQYINMKSKSTSVVGYEWQVPFNIDLIESEKAIAHIVKIGRQQLVGEAVESKYVMVDLDEKVGSEADTYKARMVVVDIKFDKFGSDDGSMTGEGAFLGKEDVVVGEFNTSTKTFTAGAIAG